MTNTYNFKDELDHLLQSQTHYQQTYLIRTNYNNANLGDGVKNLDQWRVGMT